MSLILHDYKLQTNGDVTHWGWSSTVTQSNDNRCLQEYNSCCRIIGILIKRERKIVAKFVPSFVPLLNRLGALWCSGLCLRLVIRGSWVRILLGAYAPRQGILSSIVSLDPGVVNGYTRQEFIPCNAFERL